MLEFETSKKVKPHISIAPLVDCVLLLLIFFLLSSYFATQPGIKITLPTSSTAKPQEEEIIIFINRNNEIYVGNERIDITNLKNVLAKMLEKSTQKSVTLKADEKIDLGLAVRVIDTAKDAGAEGVIISTKTPSK